MIGFVTYAVLLTLGFTHTVSWTTALFVLLFWSVTVLRLRLIAVAAAARVLETRQSDTNATIKRAVRR